MLKAGQAVVSAIPYTPYPRLCLYLTTKHAVCHFFSGAALLVKMSAFQIFGKAHRALETHGYIRCKPGGL
jgi:hypothetical protein